jgi:hypothetical protein
MVLGEEEVKKFIYQVDTNRHLSSETDHISKMMKTDNLMQNGQYF